MGSSQSTPQRSAEERKRQQEIDRQRKAREEEEKIIREEQSLKKAETDEKTQRFQLERELENKKLDLQHEEEMQRIANAEKSNERENLHLEKTTQLEHDRLLQNQEKVLSIVGDLFKRVDVKDINEAAFAVTVLQSIQAGKPVDKDVLAAVKDKVPDPPPTDIKRLVHNIIKTCEEEEEENVNDSVRRPLAPPRTHREDSVEY